MLYLSVLNFIPKIDIPPVYGSPDNIENSPSAYENCSKYWLFPHRTYVSDNQRAFVSSPVPATYYCTLKGYNVEIPSDQSIDEVLVKVESYSDDPTHEGLLIQVTNDSGTTWGDGHNVDFDESEEIYTLDVTNDFAWTPQGLNNTNFKVRMMWRKFAVEGCFSEQTYFSSWNESVCPPYDYDPNNVTSMPWILKNVAKAEVGDWILASNHDEGIHWDKIGVVNKHYGNWTLYDVWSGDVTIKYKDEAMVEQEFLWSKHTSVTGNHKSLIFRNGSWVVIPAKEITTNDSMRFVYHEDVELGPNECVPVEDHMLKTTPIQQILVKNITGWVYDLQTDDTRKDWLFVGTITESEFSALTELESKYGVNLGAYLDVHDEKWTTYVDWVPVNITYSPPSEDTTAPTYSNVGVNTTQNGQPCLFHTLWADNVNMSGYIFGTNNTGAWNNDTWADWTPVGTPKWSNVSKTLNTTKYITIEWRIWANDTSNNWNNTGTQSFMTTFIDCAFIGVNNTVVGLATKFYSDWSDLNATQGLSHFLISLNQTGTWVNSTWSNNWSGNWAEYEDTLIETAGVVVAFRFYVNDTSGTEFASTICFFTTQEQGAEPELEGGAGPYTGEPSKLQLVLSIFDSRFVSPLTRMYLGRQINFEGVLWTFLIFVGIIVVLKRATRRKTTWEAQ